MQVLIPIKYLMGIIKLPKINDYWSRRSLLNIPSVKEIISRDRFKKLPKN